MNDFQKASSNRRLLICTIAFGMGVNIPDIRYVYHWGPPGSILDYWQQVGRCGRDDKPSEAYMFTPTRSVNKKFVEQDMIDIVKSQECICAKDLNHLKLDDVKSESVADACGKDQCCSACQGKLP